MKEIKEHFGKDYPTSTNQFFSEVDTEAARDQLRQVAAFHALGRKLSEEELQILRKWREKHPERAIIESHPEVKFPFSSHFGELSVTENYGKRGGNESSLVFQLYANTARLDKRFNLSS